MSDDGNGYVDDLHGWNFFSNNNSIYSQSLHAAIIRAAKAGILFIAAAGNGDSNGNGINN